MAMELQEKDQAEAVRKAHKTEQPIEIDPMAKARQVIREAIITSSNKTIGEDEDQIHHEKNNKEVGTKNLDDVLAFSRAVNQIDSSLE